MRQKNIASTEQAEAKRAFDRAIDKPDITAGLAVELESWGRELIAPVFPGSRVRNEDWGPGGANQKNPNPNAAKPKTRD